jgi:prophage regulatory protein
MSNTNNTRPRSILRLAGVLERTGMKKSSLFAQMAAGKFPKSVAIAGTRSTGWDSHAIDAYVDAQFAGAANG